MNIGKTNYLFLELPSIPIFYDTNGTVINNFTAPHQINSALKVKCEVHGGNFSTVNFVFSIYQYTHENQFLSMHEYIFFVNMNTVLHSPL